MMRLTKRALSAFLAFVMVFTMLPLDVWAEGSQTSGNMVSVADSYEKASDNQTLELDSASTVIAVEGTHTFNASLKSEDGTTTSLDGSDCKWTSSKEDVATVEGGVVTGVGVGTAQITCTYSGLETFAMVTVTEANYRLVYQSAYPDGAMKYTYQNGGSASIGAATNTTVNETYKPGATATVASGIFTTINYDLVNYLGSDGNTYDVNDTITMNSNLTLTAQWERNGNTTSQQQITVRYYKISNTSEYVDKTVTATFTPSGHDEATVTFITGNNQDTIKEKYQDFYGWTIDGQNYTFNEQVTTTATDKDGSGIWLVKARPLRAGEEDNVVHAQFFIRKADADGYGEADQYYSVGSGTVNATDFERNPESGNIVSGTVAGSDNVNDNVNSYILTAPSAAQIANLMNITLDEASAVRWYVIKNQGDGFHVDGVIYLKDKYWRVEFVDPDTGKVVQTLLVEDADKIPVDQVISEDRLNNDLRDFTHWVDEEEKAVNLNDLVVTGDIRLTADFTRYSGYKVEYYLQNADDDDYTLDEERTETHKEEVNEEVTVTPGRIDGYEFTQKDSITSGIVKKDETLVLKLYYDRIKYDVTYEYEGSTIPEGAKDQIPDAAKYKHGATVTVANEPVVTGYQFSGWDVETPTSVTLGEDGTFTMPSEHVTFTGSWTKLYTVTYDKNDDQATGEMNAFEVKEGGSHTVQANGFTKTNYHFVGWNAQADGSGESYLKDAVISGISSNITLYAQWEIDEKDYTIEYYLDGEPAESPYKGAPTKGSADIGTKVYVKGLNGFEIAFDAEDGGHYVLDEHESQKILEITIDADATQNVLKVYYASDNKGNEKDPDTPDEIPDKYQVIFRYVPDSNGSITGITHETITKTDDVTTAKPTGTTFAADDGYKFQKWTRSTDNTEDNDKEMGTFKEPSYIWGSEVTFTVHFTKLDNLSYTIHHYLLGTTVKVADDTTDIGTFQDTVRVEAAKSFISGYEKAKYDSKTTETITITTGTNEATVYYKMPLTIKADDARRVYNGQPLTCGTFTVDGLVNDDNQNEISLSMTAESTITDAGWVDNVIDEKTVGGVKPYYEVTYEKGTLTIEPIDNLVVTISGNQKQEVYNGQTQNVSGYTAKFTVGDQEVTGVYDLDDFTYGGESTTASGKDAETYTVELDQTKFTWKDATNFEGVTFVVEKDIVLTITPKPITVTAINLEMDYGKTVPTPKINKEDLDAQLANGDTIQYTPYIDFKGANEDKPPVGTYDIKFEETDGVQGNYNVTYVPATLTVNAPSDFPYVTKGHENGTFDSAGDEVTFNITVYNIYDVPAAVELREQTGVTFIAAEGATLSENGTVLNDTLDPNSSKTYQATYTVTQADLRNGKIDNTVDLALTVGEDTIYDTATDSVIGLEAEATLAVEKTVQNPQASYGPGETITYNIKVTNTGNQTLTDVTLTDTLKADEAVVGNLTITGYDGPFELTPGEFKNFTVTYEVKEADLGKTLRNFATATAENPKEGEEDVTGTGNTPGEETDTPNPKLDVKKTLENAHEDGSSFKLGEEIRYKIVVTNTGNVTIKGIVVSDVMHEKLADGTLEKIDEGTVHYAGEGTFSGILEPEQSATFTFEYTVQEADLGKTLVNIATATGEDPRDSEKDITGTGNTPGEKTDSPNPKLDVEKTVENADGTPFKLGETIKYKIVVTNTGNVTLTGINVTDKMTHKNGDGTLLTGGVLLDKNDEPSNGVIEKLVPKGQEGESSATFYYTYVVQESDLGKTIVNTATAAGNENKEDPGKGEVEVTPDTRNPELKVVKTASTPKDEKDFALGETIDYTITLTNTGNVTLNVSIRDFFGTQDDASTVQEDITEKLICTDKDFNGTLRPEASVKYTYSYKVTEADLGKDIVNTVEYTALDDTNVPAQQNEESVTEVTSQTDDPDPDLAVEKKVVKDAGYKPTGKDENGNDVYALDDTIHYRITVSNTGNVTLTNVSVEDVLKDSLGNVIKPLDLTGAKNFTLVPVGQTGGVSSKTFDVYYTVKEENLGKTLVNTVTAASGQTQPDPEDPNNDDHDETDGEKTEKPSPNMSVTKEVVDKQISYRVGDVITYQITVTNTGNTTIHNVELMDHMNAHGKVTFKDLGDGQMVGGSPVLAALAPKTAWVVTCQYTVQLADADSDGNVISNKVVVTSDGGPSDDAETSGEKIDPIYTVVIKYQNGAGADLHDPAVVKVHDGQKYSVDSPNVPGYHLTNANQKTVSGTLDADSPYISEEGVLTLVVVYARNPVEDDDDDPVVNPDNDPDETTEETEDEVDPGVYIEDPDDYTLTPITEEEPPLADLDVGDHTCCIMHFLLMLAAMVVLGFYTDSKKKHQARIFELKRTLAMEKGKNPDGDNSQQS